jgi:predicted 2-oxoglutarate/Fe(II)-dependent dioxygenase YbiX
MIVLPAFLSAAEIAELLARDTGDGWKPGRQGTGYDTLPLARDALAYRALAHVGTPFEDYWDVYLIRYRDGSHIPPHTDAAQHGRQHRRLNALLVAPQRGGELRIAGARVDLAIGDAVVFEPDRDQHQVSTVVGERVLFSVGAWV